MSPRDARVELAGKFGINAAHVIERWEERAVVREYDGGQARQDAERDAFDDVRAELEANRSA
jgi:hypothetical protein